MTDFMAITDQAWSQETKTVSSTVLTYQDFSTLTKPNDFINGYRLQAAGKIWFTLDGSTPASGTGFYLVADQFIDLHSNLWKTIKLIRDTTVDANLTVCPIQLQKR